MPLDISINGLAVFGAPMPGEDTLSLWELIWAAGWVMVPLAICSIAVLTLVIFNLMTMRDSAIITRELERRIPAFLEKEDLDGLEGFLADRPQAVARILDKTMRFMKRHRDLDPEAARAVAETEGARIATLINQRAVYLMDLGVLAPMLGLFGTVVGILRSFGSIAAEEATTMRTMLLAGGVSQALVATAVGLIVGILAMAFYTYFRGRVIYLVSLLESHATPLVQELIIVARRHQRSRL